MDKKCISKAFKIYKQSIITDIFWRDKEVISASIKLLYIMLLDANKQSKKLENLTQEDKDFIYRNLLTLFMDWNGSDSATDENLRADIQTAVFYCIGLLDQKKPLSN